MGKIPRSDRHELIAMDEGAPTDNVFVRVISPPKGLFDGGGQISSCYHDDQDCSNLKKVEKTRVMERATAQARIKYPCKRCVLGREWSNTGKLEVSSCPYCGEDIARGFREHLPCSGVKA